MNWTKRANALPQQQEGENDSIPCLVIRNGYLTILCWNTYFSVWDDEDGDDVVCDPDGVDYWMRLADLPPIPKDEANI